MRGRTRSIRPYQNIDHKYDCAKAAALTRFLQYISELFGAGNVSPLS